jgi:serine/threonine protein kinase
MSHIQQLQKLIVNFLLVNNIPLTLDLYLIDFQKIGDIFTFLKSVYLVFFQKLDMMLFYEFVKYVLREFYKYEFVKYKNVKCQKPQIPNCLKFESTQFKIYLIIQQKPDGTLSIRNKFKLKLNTFHQGKKHKYFVSRSISKGSYGKVYLCVDENGNQFAMKLFQFSHEMDIELKALNHLEDIDQVIPVIDSFNFSLLGIKFGSFVMPFMEYTLKSFVEKKKPSEDFLLRVFYQLLCYIHIIHKKGVIHMDIKPENILINVYPDGTVDMKLSDFGLAEILPKGTHYATTSEPKITEWFRCPVNAIAQANNTDFHISWIADFFALCVSMIYMCSRKSGKSFDFLNRSMFNIFRGQQFFKSNCEDDESPKELDIELSINRIEIACRNAIKNPFFHDILIEYMNLESILRWYSELEKSPKDNSVIPEVIQKIEEYLRMTESDSETPPRQHATSSP